MPPLYSTSSLFFSALDTDTVEHANVTKAVPEFDDPRFAELDDVNRRNRARNAEANKDIRAIRQKNADAREVAWDANTGDELLDEMNAQVCARIKSNLIASRCRSLTEKVRGKCGKNSVTRTHHTSPAALVQKSPQNDEPILLPGKLMKYFKMLKMQIPLHAVHGKMAMDGVSAEHIELFNDHHIGYVKNPSRFQFKEDDGDDDGNGELKGAKKLNAAVKNYVTPEALAECSAKLNEITKLIRDCSNPISCWNHLLVHQ